jgi:hypothetical protein
MEQLRQLKSQIRQQAAAGAAPGSTFDPIGQPTFSTFGGGAGQGTAEHRLATLQQLLDKGMLTQSEYETKRQQIIDGL